FPGNTTFDGNERLEVEDGDLAHLCAEYPRIAGQGAEDIAGAQLLLAPGSDAQRHHRRLQGFAGQRLEIAQRIPVEGRLLTLLDGPGTVGFRRSDQADRDTSLAGTPGSPVAMHMYFRVALQPGDDYHVHDVDIQPQVRTL